MMGLVVFTRGTNARIAFYIRIFFFLLMYIYIYITCGVPYVKKRNARRRALVPSAIERIR